MYPATILCSGFLDYKYFSLIKITSGKGAKSTFVLMWTFRMLIPPAPWPQLAGLHLPGLEASFPADALTSLPGASRFASTPKTPQKTFFRLVNKSHRRAIACFVLCEFHQPRSATGDFSR